MADSLVVYLMPGRWVGWHLTGWNMKLGLVLLRVRSPGASWHAAQGPSPIDASWRRARSARLYPHRIRTVYPTTCPPERPVPLSQITLAESEGASCTAQLLDIMIVAP